MRGPRAGQSAKVENRRLAPHIFGHALRGRDSLRSYPRRGESDRSTSVAQAASLHAPDSKGLVTARLRRRARPIHGRRLYSRRCVGGGIRQYRDRRRPHIPRDGGSRDPSTCASGARSSTVGTWQWATGSLYLRALRSLHIRKSIDYIERRAGEIVEIYHEQANVFSGIVGIFGVQALDRYSPYRKHKHPDIAQQRFPDLSLGGKLDPPPEQALESKGSTRPWAVQSHYDHPGWYIIWRYLVDPTKAIKRGVRSSFGESTSRLSTKTTGSMRVAEPVRAAAAARTLSDYGHPQSDYERRQHLSLPVSRFAEAGRLLRDEDRQ